ncbi:tRNA (Guanine37-N(1)-) methyltransferase [Bryocella elongata]|uniref:tRNA (guanine-N(1)-)-methyltransferase n=1 Tax=Bryocella elongata TaxID=863522 RepID=A0A1H5T5W5_9BACT|nr:tRNA (guanosine(37)-N1)-methyltransferase TrmD [Bryocella elongata]SEF58144.1 tRNA (Guanine37-N(1)-) methyltransferase [Bryocella elongata]
MRFELITIFPEFFGSPADGKGLFAFGVVSRAFREGTAELAVHDLRAFTHDRHRTVDDRPFGGGEGMVLKPGPIAECLESLGLGAKNERDTSRERVVLLSAQGRRFTQAKARELAGLDRIVLISGRYEGVDERVVEMFCDEELAIGDYVLSGGELGAAVIVDAVTRLLPGVLGHADSSRFESFGEGDAGEHKTEDGVPRSTHGAGGILDYPHYTRPAEFRGLEVPAPLQNGDHLVIRKYRREAALTKTFSNRPDLLKNAELSKDDRKHLESLGWNEFAFDE